MKTRLLTAFVLISATALLILVTLGERSVSEAKTHQFAPVQLLTDDSPESKDASIINPGNNGYLPSNSTIAATDVTTHYVFLPIVVKPAVPEVVLQMVTETNFQRSQHGCGPVTLNMQLTDAAQGHSLDMALNDFVSHTGSDGSSPWERIQATGYQFSRAAENVAAGYATPEDVVTGWMSSNQGHRENILNCHLEEIGVGYYYLEDDQGSKNYHHYWTQDLATSR